MRKKRRQAREPGGRDAHEGSCTGPDGPEEVADGSLLALDETALVVQHRFEEVETELEVRTRLDTGQRGHPSSAGVKQTAGGRFVTDKVLSQVLDQ